MIARSPARRAARPAARWRPGRARRQALCWLLCGAWLWSGCGPPADEQLAVLQRELVFEREPLPVAATPLQSRHWDGAALAAEWRASRAATELLDGQLHLTGRARFELTAPAGALDTRRQQTLELTLACSGVADLTVQWHGPGAEYDEAHGFGVPVDADDRLQTVSVLLRPIVEAGLRGEVSEWRLAFSGRVGEFLAVRLERLSLLCDFDDAVGSGLAPLTMVRQGVRLSGHALALPGALSTTLRGGPGQRLWLQLATTARERPLTVTLRDSSGRLPPRELLLVPEEPWQPLRVELSELPADEQLTLTLSAEDGPGFLLVGAVLHLGPDGARRPDVVLWLVDTLRPDRLGSYGYGKPTDPVLAGLAGQGVLFRTVYSVSNWTRPAVSSIHTGVGPEVHGNHSPGLAIDPRLPTLAGQLARAGYLTVSLNSNHHAGVESGLDRGFDMRYEPAHFPRSDPPTTLTSGQIMDALEPLLTAHEHERLFVSVHCLDPHGPYEPLARDLAALDTGAGGARVVEGVPVEERIRFGVRSPRYDAEVLHADRSLGRLDSLLAEQGRQGDTLLAFISDHGEGFYEHETWGHWRGLYQEEVLVPWVLRWPAGLPAGRVVEGPVSLIDLAPTLLGLLQLERPPAWRGRDLAAVCRGARAAPDELVLIDSVAGGSVERGLRRLAVVRDGLKLLAVVDEQGQPSPSALYDLRSDPGEIHDLLSRRPVPAGLLAALADYLDRDGRRAQDYAAEGAVDPEQLRWLEELGYLGR